LTAILPPTLSIVGVTADRQNRLMETFFAAVGGLPSAVKRPKTLVKSRGYTLLNFCHTIMMDRAGLTSVQPILLQFTPKIQ
jgi:hypothetical protein